MSENIARDCYVEYMRDDGDDAHGDFVRIVGKAIADARAAAYADGVRDSERCRRAASDIPITIDRARALAPADKEKP